MQAAQKLKPSEFFPDSLSSNHTELFADLITHTKHCFATGLFTYYLILLEKASSVYLDI